jgi:hypothetical protein
LLDPRSPNIRPSLRRRQNRIFRNDAAMLISWQSRCARFSSEVIQ